VGQDQAHPVFAGLVEKLLHPFERALIHERQREGIALAKQRGAYKGRKKAVMQLRTRITAGISKAKVAREFGISRQTLYQYLQGSEAAP
jgi:DNA invertase Pin-like site-specific DNA recombinase